MVLYVRPAVRILASGYERRRQLFRGHVGLFQYNMMPFGLCNVPATFEAMRESLLSDLLWEKCLVYLDDVIVFGKTFEQCMSNLEEIFKRIICNGLKLKPKKCSLFNKSMVYLGRIVSTECEGGS